MIEFIFTLDYEIYGDGSGTLRELVYEPTEQLRTIFRKWNAQFVAFIEVAELEKIEAHETDEAIPLVKKQIQDLCRDNHEIALHLHPQWCNARRQHDKWVLDYGEYNLCILPRRRISEIVDRSLQYLRKIVGQTEFIPLSFRAGNWLFQPTGTAASMLEFCRMNLRELTAIMNLVIQNDRQDPSSYKPIVAIGHTKDLTDPRTVDNFLAFLRTNGITISTFAIIYSKLLNEMSQAPCITGGCETQSNLVPVLKG